MNWDLRKRLGLTGLQARSGDPIQLHGYFAAVRVREGDIWKIRLDAVIPAAPAERVFEKFTSFLKER